MTLAGHVTATQKSATPNALLNACTRQGARIEMDVFLPAPDKTNEVEPGAVEDLQPNLAQASV